MIHRVTINTVFKLGFRVSQKGFTLIETLVSISILAISLVIILQLFSGGLRSSKLSDEYTKSIFHASEKMEEILLLKNLSEGELEGEYEDRFKWKAKIIRLEPQEEEAALLPFDTFSIKVSVAWYEGQRERHFDISTMKITEKVKDDEFKS